MSKFDPKSPKESVSNGQLYFAMCDAISWFKCKQNTVASFSLLTCQKFWKVILCTQYRWNVTSKGLKETHQNTINPLCASPPQLWKLACLHATRILYLEIDFPTMPNYCLLQYNQRKFVFFCKKWRVCYNSF